MISDARRRPVSPSFEGRRKLRYLYNRNLAWALVAWWPILSLALWILTPYANLGEPLPADMQANQMGFFMLIGLVAPLASYVLKVRQWLLVTPDGVRDVYTLWRKSFVWEEIEHFEYSNGVLIKLRNGSEHAVPSLLLVATQQRGSRAKSAREFVEYLESRRLAMEQSR